MSSLFEKRRSIRRFAPGKPVTRGQLERLLAAAMLAPSACNMRPWEFVVITNRGVLDRIARVHASVKLCDTAAAAIVVVAAPQSGRAEGYFQQDCAAATENILLEVAALGLGACWCGVYPREARVAALREILGITDPKKIPFNVIAIGFPAENPPMRGFFEPSKIRWVE
ncbi:MAG: nitroreductase family protein [Opitutaceae bacterium]|jgi:nitroreductase|nr:nitroreductase family protein [Opitutaceae bacterium]